MYFYIYIYANYHEYIKLSLRYLYRSVQSHLPGFFFSWKLSGATKFSWPTLGKYLYTNVASAVSNSFFFLWLVCGHGKIVSMFFLGLFGIRVH